MKANFFRSPEAFRAPESYQILPFRFLRWDSSEVFLSNDVGEWHFLSARTFDSFANGRLTSEAPEYADLKGKHFLADSGLAVPVQLLATKYRTKKDFLKGFTRLHMFVVTLRCDHTCAYCQVSRVTEDRTRYDMTRETAMRAVEFMFSSPSPFLKVEFQGGEALLHFDAVRWIVEAVVERNRVEGRSVEFVITTNLSQVTDEVLAFCAEHKIYISTSIDGPADLHNANRPRPGRNSYERAVANIDRVRAALGPDSVSALMTTTVDSLRHPVEIVDKYVELGFRRVFLRPISPYGFAIKTKQAFRYQTDAFLDFYQAALDRILYWNRAGIPMIEVYSQIVLRKLLTPFATGYVDLQSPAGAGLSAVLYNYDGDVYASDEGRMLAEMDDKSFRLGNLHSDKYEDVMGGERLRTIADQSCSEVMPGCSECAYLPFCGADPVYHWATQGDLMGHRPTSGFCRRNMGTIRHLLSRLRSSDPHDVSVLNAWGTH